MTNRSEVMAIQFESDSKNNLLKKVKYLFILTLVVCSVIACTSPATRDWHTAKKVNTTTSYSKFLKKFPSSEFSLEARARLEQEEWRLAVKSDTAKEYSAFLKNYAGAKFSAEARTRLDRLKRIERKAALVENRAKIQMVLKYTSSLTEIEFLDQWNGKAPFFFKIGLIDIHRSKDGVRYVLGIRTVPRIKFIGLIPYYSEEDKASLMKKSRIVTTQLIGTDYSRYTGSREDFAEEFEKSIQGYRNRINTGRKPGFVVKNYAHGIIEACWLDFGNDGKLKNMKCPVPHKVLDDKSLTGN